MAPDIIERCLPLLPFTYARSESINADSLNSTSYSWEEEVVAGHSGQFIPGGYLSTVVHTTLVGLKPTTFRLLVRRATSSATDSVLARPVL